MCHLLEHVPWHMLKHLLVRPEHQLGQMLEYVLRLDQLTNHVPKHLPASHVPKHVLENVSQNRLVEPP